MINWPIPSYEGERYEAPNGKIWEWNGYAWDFVGPGYAVGPTGPTGPEGPRADVSPISVTYSEFYNAYTEGSLSPGNWYEISDFKTAHYILEDPSNPTNYGDDEPILVFATGLGTIDKRVISQIYPEDIIYWDPSPENWYTDLSFSDMQSPSSLVPEFKGVITYRKDTLRNLEAFYDWRAFVFRRWSVDVASISTYNPSTVYNVGDLVLYSGEIFALVYKEDVSPYVTPPIAANEWVKIFDENSPFILSQPLDYELRVGSTTYTGNPIVLLPVSNDYRDLLTFSGSKSDSFLNISIEKLNLVERSVGRLPSPSTMVPNNVFVNNMKDVLDLSNVKIKGNCSLNTFQFSGSNTSGYFTGNIEMTQCENIIVNVGRIGSAYRSGIDNLKIESGYASIINFSSIVNSTIKSFAGLIMSGDLYLSEINGIYSTFLSPNIKNLLLKNSSISELYECNIMCNIQDSRIYYISDSILGNNNQISNITIPSLGGLDFYNSTYIYDSNLGAISVALAEASTYYLSYVDSSGTPSYVNATD